MIPTEFTKEVLVKTSPQLVLSEITIQRLLDLEVDTLVLYQELTKLVGICSRIGGSFRDLRLSASEQELVD